MALEPSEILDVESPRLPFQLLCSEILLICPGMIIEDVKQCLDIQLGKDPGCVQDRMRMLRVVRWGLERVARDIVLWFLGILWLWHAGITALQEFMYLIKVAHPL